MFDIIVPDGLDDDDDELNAIPISDTIRIIGITSKNLLFAIYFLPLNIATIPTISIIANDKVNEYGDALVSFGLMYIPDDDATIPIKINPAIIEKKK